MRFIYDWVFFITGLLLVLLFDTWREPFSKNANPLGMNFTGQGSAMMEMASASPMTVPLRKPSIKHPAEARAGRSFSIELHEEKGRLFYVFVNGRRTAVMRYQENPGLYDVELTLHRTGKSKIWIQDAQGNRLYESALTVTAP